MRFEQFMDPNVPKVSKIKIRIEKNKVRIKEETEDMSNQYSKKDIGKKNQLNRFEDDRPVNTSKNEVINLNNLWRQPAAHRLYSNFVNLTGPNPTDCSNKESRERSGSYGLRRSVKLSQKYQEYITETDGLDELPIDDNEVVLHELEDDDDEDNLFIQQNKPNNFDKPTKSSLIKEKRISTLDENQLKLQIRTLTTPVVQAFQCQLCNFKTVTSIKLKRHISQKHSTDELFQNQVIRKYRNSETGTVKRKTNQSVNKTYQCDKCVFRTLEKVKFKRHLKEHNKSTNNTSLSLDPSKKRCRKAKGNVRKRLWQKMVSLAKK